MNKLFIFYHSEFYLLLSAPTPEEAYKLIPDRYKTTVEGYLIPFQTGCDLLQDTGKEILASKEIIIVLPTKAK